MYNTIFGDGDPERLRDAIHSNFFDAFKDLKEHFHPAVSTAAANDVAGDENGHASTQHEHFDVGAKSWASGREGEEDPSSNMFAKLLDAREMKQHDWSYSAEQTARKLQGVKEAKLMIIDTPMDSARTVYLLVKVRLLISELLQPALGPEEHPANDSEAVAQDSVVDLVLATPWAKYTDDLHVQDDIQWKLLHIDLHLADD